MSSSSRLAKLRRSVAPMIPEENGQNENGENRQIPNEQRKMVQPMTILTWHEERLNKIDNMLESIKSTPSLNEAEVVVPIVESIEVLEGQIRELQRQLDNINIKRANAVKLDIKEK